MHRSSRRQFLRTAGLAAGALGVGFAGPASALGALDSAGTDRAALLAGEPLRMARVWLTRETAHLADGLDDTHRSFGDGSYEFLLWPGDLGRLVQTGLRFEITVDDVVARDRARTESSAVRTVGRQPGETETGEYRRLDDYNADMAALAADNFKTIRLIRNPYDREGLSLPSGNRHHANACRTGGISNAGDLFGDAVIVPVSFHTES